LDILFFYLDSTDFFLFNRVELLWQQYIISTYVQENFFKKVKTIIFKNQRTCLEPVKIVNLSLNRRPCLKIWVVSRKDLMSDGHTCIITTFSIFSALVIFERSGISDSTWTLMAFSLHLHITSPLLLPTPLLCNTCSTLLFSDFVEEKT
jgi:hypothetical protein